LTASGGTTYSWNTNPVQTTAAITVSPLMTTTYTVTVSNGPGCSATASRTVTVLPSPIAAISSDLNICSSESTTLTASNTSTVTTGANTFAWNTTPPQTTASITVSPTTTTLYTVTITNNNGCSDVESVTVAVNPKITGNDLACKNLTESITNLGTVSVKASKFIDFAVVPCNIEEFKFSYSSTNINDTLKIYNCDSVGIRNVKIFFYQNGAYLNDSCLATVTITDPPTTGNPNGFCPNNIFILTGQISTENLIPVEDVEVNLVNINMNMTNKNGLYEFPKMQAAENYMVQPVKEDGILEGVSTLDLIMIQRHILGVSKLTSPYKLIAADITNDRKISAADLVELRKIVLGVKENFANNSSWKFVDANYKFPDPSNPFSSDFPLYHEFIKPAGNNKADFIGVKIGDVNNSFINKLASPSDEYSIRMHESKTTPSKQNEIGVYIDNVTGLDGFQLEFSMEDIEDLSISSTLFNEEELKYYFDGKILTISVALTKEVNVSGLELFSIKGFGMDNTKISLSSNKINDEVYIGGRNYAIVEAYTDVEDESYSTVSNAPNPWNNETTIHFESMKEQNVDVIIKDLHGRTIYAKTVLSKLGENKVRISSDDIQNSNGMLLYEVVLDHKKLVGKMLHLN
jgi:Dockerin type I domain